MRPFLVAFPHQTIPKSVLVWVNSFLQKELEFVGVLISFLFDLTRLSRIDCINWQLSINLTLPREKDTYFSMLVSYGAHNLVRIVALQVVKHNGDDYCFGVNPKIVNITSSVSSTSIFACYVAVIPDRISNKISNQGLTTNIASILLRKVIWFGLLWFFGPIKGKTLKSSVSSSQMYILKVLL